MRLSARTQWRNTRSRVGGAANVPGRLVATQPLLHPGSPGLPGRTTLDLVLKPTRPAFDSTAPKEWLSAGTSASRLYCRLLKAIAAGDDAVKKVNRDHTASDQLELAMNELRRQAIAITEHLVVVSHLPVFKRQNGLRPLRSQVDEVERLAARIGTSAVHARGHKGAPGGAEEVKERLDALDQARQEAEAELPEEERKMLTRALKPLRRVRGAPRGSGQGPEGRQ